MASTSASNRRGRRSRHSLSKSLTNLKLPSLGLHFTSEHPASAATKMGGRQRRTSEIVKSSVFPDGPRAANERDRDGAVEAGSGEDGVVEVGPRSRHSLSKSLTNLKLPSLGHHFTSEHPAAATKMGGRQRSNCAIAKSSAFPDCPRAANYRDRGGAVEAGSGEDGVVEVGRRSRRHSLSKSLTNLKLPSLGLHFTSEYPSPASTKMGGRRRSTCAIAKSSVFPDGPRAANDRDRDGAVEAGSGEDGVVEVGSAVPDFTLVGVDGKSHSISDFRGRKVMLCFYRYSRCPKCAYTISKLIGHYKKLAWASKLTVITVFRTDLEFLRRGLRDADAPIRKLAGIGASGYPFLGLADPHGTAAASFGVDRKAIMRLSTILYSSVRPRVRDEVYRGGARGGDTLLPSEFLIDEDGVLADVLRATKKDESMALFRVNAFLLGGRKTGGCKDPWMRQSV